MDLKSTINDTNTHKENIKTVATQIDNKLVELGGEKATNLSDVVSKLDKTVNTQYKKVAIGTVNVTTTGDDIRIPLNLNFEPSVVFCKIKKIKEIPTGLALPKPREIGFTDPYEGWDCYEFTFDSNTELKGKELQILTYNYSAGAWSVDGSLSFTYLSTNKNELRFKITDDGYSIDEIFVEVEYTAIG